MEIFDDDSKGMQLLKKGQKGLVYLLFSRLGIIVVLLVLQILVLASVFGWFAELLPHYVWVSILFSLIMLMYLLNSNMGSSSKITWMVLFMVTPVFGGLLFWYTQSEIGHRAVKARMHQLLTETKAMIPQDQKVLDHLEEESPGSRALAHYLSRSGCHPVYDKTDVAYFPLGEDKFQELLIQLKQAKHFIFLEYFIVDEGLMWGKVLEILAQKAAEGVEVRMMYDGTNEFSTLPHDYPKRLRKLGIQCKVFARAIPLMSTHYNYRDHRKILVIDGHTAFTGGINLADEYINKKEKYGHWKDTAIMLKGEAVKSFTLMFLQMWNTDERNADFSNYLDYPAFPQTEASGYVVPYGDCPLDDDKVGERVYMDILNRAQKYVHIMSPYLILDDEMEAALKFAAERGVDVKLILPGIPDKYFPYALAKTHYRTLLDAGVKIYEYTPGFVHAKVFVCDDRKAVVGTINLDYRSLYHHFECAAYLYKASCIPAIEEDFQETLSKCRTVTYETIKHEKWTLKLCGQLMKGFAPLM